MLNHKIENLKRLKTTKDTDVVIRKLSTNVSLGPDIFTGEFYQTFNIINPKPSPPKPVPFWVLQEKQLQKGLPKHFFVAGMDKYFSHQFLLVPECLSLTEKRSFPAFEILHLFQS